MSTDCGQTWVMKYTKSGNSLETVNSTAINFIPTANEWRQDAMNINTASGQSNVRFKFQFTSDGGNNIFIDDINISGITSADEIDVNEINLTVRPNPASHHTAINFELMKSEMVAYELTDLTGRILIKSETEKLSADMHNIKIRNTFSTGLYYLNLTIGGKRYFEKVIFK